MIRRGFVIVHRWAGLAMAAFLILEGLTGSLLAFRGPLERLLAPQHFAKHREGVPRLDLAALALKAEALVPNARVAYFSYGDDQVVFACPPRVDPATGKPFALDFYNLFLDPWTGKELGRRPLHPAPWSRAGLMPFLFDLHMALALGGAGVTFLGAVALVWTFDAFVGFYLTLPSRRTGFWRRWRPAWLVKWSTRNAFRINFDVHRASGLWLWPILFVFSWSSVMLNLGAVYDWTMGKLFDYESDMAWFASRPLPPNETPRLGWREAQATGERLMAEEAARRGFRLGEPNGLAYLPELGVYSYDVHSTLDVRASGWNTGVWLDGNTGEPRRYFLPTGERSGTTITTWLGALHFADVGGSFVYRVFVSVLGVGLVALSGTGVYIWWKKRRGRVPAGQARAARPASGTITE